jgi:hypothetical protein
MISVISKTMQNDLTSLMYIGKKLGEKNKMKKIKKVYKLLIRSLKTNRL